MAIETKLYTINKLSIYFNLIQYFTHNKKNEAPKENEIQKNWSCDYL